MPRTEQDRQDSQVSQGSAGQSRPPWHAMAPDEALDKQQSNRQGLDDEQAARLLEEHGPNQIRQQKGRPWWRRLLDQFNNILIIILLIAGVAAAILGQWIDAGAIFAVVLINAIIGFIQEGKAEKALESIKGMLSPEATVKRGGKQKSIPAGEVVPGDIVIVASGARIPADIRLLRAKQFRTEEAPLTGESEPVDKGTEAVAEDTDLADRTSMAYASTVCVHGTAEGVVVATGTDTEIGRISEMLEEVEKIQTPLLRQLDRFGKVLALAIVTLAAAMAAFGVLVHDRGLQEMFMAAVGLAVAAIPQGLPAIVTITLALGVQAMAKRNAIIRRLPAVETLGAVSTIFSDKTGTLTRNEMTVSAIALADLSVEISGVGFAPEGEFRREGEGKNGGQDENAGEPLDPGDYDTLQQFLIAGVLCNDSAMKQKDDRWQIDGDPTEGSLLVVAAKAGLEPDDIRGQYRRIDDIPFESERKYMATLDQDKKGEARVIHLKGAPDVLLELCHKVLTAEGEKDLDQDQWRQRIDELSSRGLRVLALAQKTGSDDEELKEESVQSNLVLLGLAGMLDPPRDAAIGAVKECQDAGIQVRMVTGDHRLTARAIGEQLGLSETAEAMSGKDIEQISDEDLRERVMGVSVFARAAPEHKLRLVQAAQAEGRICAMTGDGVNDAPALKAADVGVAMGIQGTEAAKEAAEMVLADDNFATIVNAVEEGRRVYDNIRKTITFLLPSNGAESLAILIAVLAGTMLPITPVQILWINMVTAVTLGLALAFEPAESDLMQRKPRDPQAPILNRFLVWRVVFVSTLLVAAVYGIFLWLRQWQGASIEDARSAAVNMLVAGEIVYLLNTRLPLARSLSFRGLFGSRAVLIAIALVVILQLLWTYAPPLQFLFESTPLGGMQWALIGAVAITIFLIIEVEKAVWRRLLGQDKTTGWR